MSVIWELQDVNATRGFKVPVLINEIRRGRYTGMEYVRKLKAENWIPLYRTKVFAQAIPEGVDPVEYAVSAQKVKDRKTKWKYWSMAAVLIGTPFALLAIDPSGQWGLGQWLGDLLAHPMYWVPLSMGYMAWRRQAQLRARSPMPLIEKDPEYKEARDICDLLRQHGSQESIESADMAVSSLRVLSTRIEDRVR